MCLLHENEAGTTHGATLRRPHLSEKADTQVGVFQDRTWNGEAGVLRRVRDRQPRLFQERRSPSQSLKHVYRHMGVFQILDSSEKWG